MAEELIDQLAAVQAKIAEKEAEVGAKDEEIRNARSDTQNELLQQERVALRQERAALLQELAVLRQKENLLLGAQLAGAAALAGSGSMAAGGLMASVEGILTTIQTDQKAIKTDQKAIKTDQKAIKTDQKAIKADQKMILANQRAQEQQSNLLLRVVAANLKQAFRPPSSGKESRGSNTHFRSAVIKHYGIRDKLKCMVLDKPLQGHFLVAGHLFAVRWALYAGITMGTEFDVNSPRNGIMWNSAIEYAYEHQLICFSYGGFGSVFVLHVLDKSLLPMKLSSVGQHKNVQDFVEALDGITFKDLDKKRVNFTSMDGKGPFKRALALHAKVALEHCEKVYPENFDPQDYQFDDVSEYDDKEQFVKLWLAKLDTVSVAEDVVNEEAASSVDPEGSMDEEVVE